MGTDKAEQRDSTVNEPVRLSQLAASMYSLHCCFFPRNNVGIVFNMLWHSGAVRSPLKPSKTSYIMKSSHLVGIQEIFTKPETNKNKKDKLRSS